MKLQKLRLQGFIGIAKGLGVEAVELDLAGMDGLISLEGDNGMGKTTLLENLQPFRTLPSRKNALKKHCYLKNSQKELVFEFGGDIYKTLVKMDPTTTVSDEGFIWKNGEPVVDGKVSNFDKYMVDLLGSQNLFFNSIFCAQNSAKLSDLKPAELKALFAEFLRLNRYVTWEATSKSAAMIYGVAISNTQNQIETLDAQIRMLGDPRADLQAAKKVAGRLEVDIAELDLKLESRNAMLKKLDAIVLKSHINREKKDALTRERDRLTAESEKMARDHEKLITDLMVKFSLVEDQAREAQKTIEAKDEIEEAIGIVKAADKVIADLESKINDAHAEIKKTDEVLEQARGEALEIERRLLDLQTDSTLSSSQAELEAVKRRINDISDKTANLHLDPDLVKIEAQIAAMMKSAAVLDDIDPQCASEVCGLITQSLEDKKRLPVAQAEYNELETQLKKRLDAQRAKLQTQADALAKTMQERASEIKALTAGYEKSLRQIKASMDNLKRLRRNYEDDLEKAQKDRRFYENKRGRAKPVADQAATIVIAESRLKDLHKQLANLQQESDRAEKEFTRNVKRLNEKLLANAQEIAAVEKLIHPTAQEEHELIEREIKTFLEDRTELAEQIVKNNAVIDACEKEIKALEAMEVELAGLKAEKQKYTWEQSHWFYLRDACSKDGLRALEIEGVAPVITGYANEMLTGSFGPNHSVRFETQDEFGKEVLDIVVINGDGSETLLSNLSGGERVWILKALRLAQTLISQEKSGRHFQTALMDEEDGALSNENAIRFISLYGTLMKMANMEACYYISHRPDAISMADHRIKFKKGGLSVS